MTPHQAQRIRFGILWARLTWEPFRLTDDQADYVESCELVGWRTRDSLKAYRRESDNAWIRLRGIAGTLLLDGGD